MAAELKVGERESGVELELLSEKKKKRIVTPPDDELRGRDAPVWRNRGRESGIYWRREGEMGRERVKKENSSRSLEKSFSQVKERNCQGRILWI